MRILRNDKVCIKQECVLKVLITRAKPSEGIARIFLGSGGETSAIINYDVILYIILILYNNNILDANILYLLLNITLMELLVFIVNLLHLYLPSITLLYNTFLYLNNLLLPSII